MKRANIISPSHYQNLGNEKSIWNRGRPTQLDSDQDQRCGSGSQANKMAGYFKEACISNIICYNDFQRLDWFIQLMHI